MSVAYPTRRLWPEYGEPCIALCGVALEAPVSIMVLTGVVMVMKTVVWLADGRGNVRN
jgi:hypothetical protein